jgi:hypothetical protein
MLYLSRGTATPVRAEPALRRAQDDRKYRQVEHKLHPVRAEPVEALLPLRRHFDKLSPFDRLRMHGHFDKLSADGVGWWADFFKTVRAKYVFPIILSLSKDRLRMHGHFDKLSANGFLGVYEDEENQVG